MSLFSVFLFSLACLPRNFPAGHPSKDYSKSSTLNCGVLMEWATKKNMHLVDIGSTNNSYKPSFSHVLPYLHDLRIPLILM
uniref:Uncharacterized protein n=1 Tax=Medicago truncatula TaxID=3880 RepID=A2Q4Y4_MEDTR|nr:hypothetical protein MtrDRAFT_AC157893g45v2 [Medicago truncatula]